MAVPNIFASATSAIPLSQLDTNFATPVTIGNTAVQLGNTVTSFGNVTLTNVTISSGNVTVSAGSNTAPSITTVGDTNTGIFFPAADTIAFTEGGVESVRIDSSGNVGIGGTAGAGTKVNTLGTLPSSSNITTSFGADGTIPSTTTNLYSGFTSGATTQATSFTMAAYQHFRAAQTAFGAGSTVTSQQGFFAASSLTGATSNYGFFSNLNAAANSWNFYAGGTANNYFAGNVGIGTTSPAGKLDVATDVNAIAYLTYARNANAGSSAYAISGWGNNSSDNAGQVAIASTANTTYGGGGDFIFLANTGDMTLRTTTAKPMTFYTNATERMRIDSSGNLLVTSAAGLGYGTGSGGTVTQATSKSTGVTLNKPTGQITMNNAALAASTNVSFQLTNSLIAITDTLVCSITTAANYSYQIQTYCGTGAAQILLRNIDSVSRSEAIVINFTVIKGATS